MASSFWLSLCLILFIHNLIDLLTDRNQLSYKVVEKGDVLFDENHDLNYLVCTPFRMIKRFDSSTDEPATRNVSVRSFLNYSIVSIKRRLKMTGLLRLNESLIFNGHVCFPTNKGELEEDRKPFNDFFEVYGLFSIFIYSKEKQPNFYERAYEKNDGLPSIYIRSYKQKVFGANHLLNADCSNRAHQIHHDRFTCLNRCFVKLRMKSGYYHFDDEGTFNLSEITEKKRIVKREVNNKALGVLKKLSIPNEVEGAKECLRKCPERACFWEVVITLKIDWFYYYSYMRTEKVNLKLNTYAAFYSMDDFYLQLFGLVSLFTGTSVLRLLHALLSLVLPVTVRKIEPLLKNEKLLRTFRLVYPNLKHALTLLCLILVLVQGLVMINEFTFHSNYPNRTSCLSRCFRVDFDLDEKHRKIPLTYLWLGFKTRNREIFLVERNKSFTSDLVNFRGLFSPQKITKTHSKSSKKSNCRDYTEEKGCDSRRNCLDRCLSTKFIEKHGSIPMNTVVSSSHLNLSLVEGIKFTDILDEEIQRNCSALFDQIDCSEVRFEESSDRVAEFSSLAYIRLSYLNIVEREMEYDPVKTFLDIIGLETILFGSNALGVLTTVLLFFCRILQLKWCKTYSVFLLLLSSAGFLAHNVLVFQAIISGDLDENEFFEKPERYTLPSPIFCFGIKKERDTNQRLTGEYLDDLTDQMTFKHAFKRILYNNRTHLKELDINKLNFTKNSLFYSSPELELTHFYYLFMKCFKISLKISYQEEDFFLLQNKTVLSIYLTGLFRNVAQPFTIFLHQQADSSEIGGGFEYKIGKTDRASNTVSHYSYRIEFEEFRIVREDQFELLKDLRRLFQERVKVNDVKTEEAIRKRFKENYNLTTDDLPLDRDFDAEVDNEMFEQHAKAFTDQAAFKSLDFEQNIANTYTNIAYSPYRLSKPDFSFSFSFLVRRVVITNRENYTKLVVSLLNTLSLWLDICVIDMGAWFSRFFAPSLYLYRLLIKTSNRLDRLRD